MYYIRNILTYFLFSLLVITSLPAKEDHRIEYQPLAFEEAASLPKKGILKQKENGFIYLDVTNDFIKTVVPLLEHPGEIRVAPTASRSVGAHISVFYEKENVIPKELNSTFSFDIKEIRSFTNHTRDGLKKHWVVAVHSPELEALRLKYGCSSKLQGNDFHITLGKQMPTAPAGWEQIDTISMLDYSNEATLGLSEIGDFVCVKDANVKKIIQTIGTKGMGQLCLKSNGYVYLDVDNQYVDKIAQLLPLQGEFVPVSTTPKKTGAHISVIYEDEMIGHEIWDLENGGEWFSFEVKELRYVERKTAASKTRLWLLAVDAPGLERLRVKYGLKPKLQGHDFHITIGSEAEECFDDMELELLPNAA